MAAKKPKARKNAAAVALSKRQLEVCSPEDRSERARRAVQARWRKARGEPEPLQFWGLFLFSRKEGTKFDPADLDHPQLVFASRDKAAVVEYARTETRRPAIISPFDGPPPAFIVKRSFKPDLAKQTKALLTVLGEGDPQ
jgi:hypothetical protein